MSASVFIRAVRRGNWKFAGLIAENTVYGLLHSRCRQCGKRKGFSTASRCASCQLSNLMRALAEPDSESLAKEREGQ